MPSYLSPGVYVEEVESGSRPIEGVGTSVAAFVGFAQRGPFDEPTLITNWSQFASTFGDFVEGTHLAASVYGFFANGGGSATSSGSTTAPRRAWTVTSVSSSPGRRCSSGRTR